MKNKIWKILGLALAFALIDQLSKLYISAKFSDIIAYNTGMAFSIQIPFFILVVFTIILLGGIVYFISKHSEKLTNKTQIALALILGGGLGNLIDRMYLGHVIDFISIWIYPTFNIADVFISAGVIILFIFHKELDL